MTLASETTTKTCQKHGAYQATVANILGRIISGRCPACAADEKAQEEERAKRDAAARANARIEILLSRSGIPPRFQGRDFDNYQAEEEGQQRALRIARAYAAEWDTMRKRGTCLIFSGEAGTGKTHLACAIANAVIRNGSAALFMTVSDAMRAVKRSYDRDQGVSEGEAIAALVEPPLLILDEVGMDYGTEHSKALLFDLMNKRYEQVRSTIVLTNLDAAALREYFGDRIMDRLREGGGKLVPFTWDSHRGK
jgi:DNA replication protein DnaC